MEESESEDKKYTPAKEIHEAVTHVKGLLIEAKKVDGKNLRSILSSG